MFETGKRQSYEERSFGVCRNTDISIVIPCYNEVDVLPILQERLAESLDGLGATWEVIFVDDGSSDGTWASLLAGYSAEPRFKAIALSRNFGHQAALSAGIAYSSGGIIGIMDADLQDPPEILPECLAKIKEGYDVVYAIRRKRKEFVVKRVAYFLFYRLMRVAGDIEIPLDSGDFCLMSRNVVNALTRMEERNIFLRGMRAWAGFRQIGIEYERAARAAGQTKYPFRRLIRLAMDGIFAFSTLPLRLATYMGLLFVFISIIISIGVVIWREGGFRVMGYTARELPGWSAIIVGLLVLSGIQLLILGIIGEYIGRIYNEVKQRPRWLMRDCLGLSAESFSMNENFQEL